MSIFVGPRTSQEADLDLLESDEEEVDTLTSPERRLSHSLELTFLGCLRDGVRFSNGVTLVFSVPLHPTIEMVFTLGQYTVHIDTKTDPPRRKTEAFETFDEFRVFVTEVLIRIFCVTGRGPHVEFRNHPEESVSMAILSALRQFQPYVSACAEVKRSARLAMLELASAKDTLDMWMKFFDAGPEERLWLDAHFWSNVARELRRRQFAHEDLEIYVAECERLCKAHNNAFLRRIDFIKDPIESRPEQWCFFGALRDFGP